MGNRYNDAVYVRLNTILLLDKGFINRVIKTASRMSVDHETEFVIDNKKCFAHITLYAPEFPDKNIDSVFSEVARLAKTVKPFQLHPSGYVEGEGFVMVGFKKSNKKIQAIHKQCLCRLNPLREGKIIDKHETGIQDGQYSAEQVNLINRYGHHNVLQNYTPHLSLCRFKDRKTAELVVSKLDNDLGSKKIMVEKIAISETGPNGTCTKILAEFDLEK